MTSIGKNAFSNCSGLTSVTISGNGTSIGDYAFYGCTGLTSLSILEGVSAIGNRAFAACPSLTEIAIPSTVTSINPHFFNDTGISGIDNNLTSIVVDEKNQYYDSRNSCNAIIEKSTNTLILGCKNTTIPSTVTSIGNGAFYECPDLTSIAIPSSVQSIKNHAFLYCRNLVSVKVDSTSPPWIDGNSFPRHSLTIYVPAGSKAAYEADDVWKQVMSYRPKMSIVEFINGDVNSDEEVDVLDVVDIVRYVVDDPADTFVPILADINANGEVNVGDAVALVNEIAGEQNFVKPWRAPQQNSVADDVLTLTSTDNGMSLCMENERNYTAFQLDLYLPAGTDATDMLLNAQRKQGHQLIYNKVEEGHYRVAAISTSNHTFSGYEGELLAVGLEGIANEDICLRNIRFFTTDGEEHQFDDIVMQSGTATDIASPQQPSNGEEAIYNLAGQRIQKMQKGINIVNGKKVMSK